MNIVPLKLDQCNKANKTCEKHHLVARLPTPCSWEVSHPWTMPPVNPRCSEKDSCNGMRENSMGEGDRNRLPSTPLIPHTSAQGLLTVALRPHTDGKLFYPTMSIPSCSNEGKEARR